MSTTDKPTTATATYPERLTIDGLRRAINDLQAAHGFDAHDFIEVMSAGSRNQVTITRNKETA